MPGLLPLRKKGTAEKKMNSDFEGQETNEENQEGESVQDNDLQGLVSAALDQCYCMDQNNISVV
jgi:hypothetical protein